MNSDWIHVEFERSSSSTIVNCGHIQEWVKKDDSAVFTVDLNIK